MKDIISEVVNNYLKSKCMLKEYKNPNDSETIRVCTDMLENIYNRIISNGGSKNEYSIEKLGKIIVELRKMQKEFMI